MVDNIQNREDMLLLTKLKAIELQQLLNSLTEEERESIESIFLKKMCVGDV